MSSSRLYGDDRLHYGVGIEDTFIPHERVGHRKLDEYELTQHYSRWEERCRVPALGHPVVPRRTRARTVRLVVDRSGR